MKRIVLIQNQTEMTHYGHADCRKKLDHLGVQFDLLTADSISSLSGKIATNEVDAILVGTNALHDPVIREHLLSTEVVLAVERFLSGGGGLVVMMQYKAAYDSYPLSFIPIALGTARAVPRPETETASLSELLAISSSLSPPLLSYPEDVDVLSLEADSRLHPSLSGVYWHFWHLDQPAFWDVHLECELGESPRPVLITSKEHTGSRVILSALPIDWHGHHSIFRNVMSFAIDGRQDTAFLTKGSSNDLITTYLDEKLNSFASSHRVYNNTYGENSEAARNLFLGIHNTVFLNEGDTLSDHFGVSDMEKINDLILTGKLRVISIDASSAGASVKILGRRSVAKDAYEFLVPAIGQALLKGFLDGSFRGTISALQELEDLPYGLDAGLFPLDHVLRECDRRDRAGSYDEVIGATAALLWVRGKALGAAHEDTQRSVAWLRSRFPATDARERLHSLGILDSIGLITEGEIALANSTLTQICSDTATEIELQSYLEGAIRFLRQDVAEAVVQELSKRQDEGAGPLWIDIPTTAALIKLLVIASQKFPSLGGTLGGIDDRLLRLIVPAMVTVEAAYHRSLRQGGDGRLLVVPWDGKIGTAVRCLSAWYLFDQFLGAPVEEAAEAVARSSLRAATTSLAGGAITSLRAVVGAYNEANEKLRDQAGLIDDAAANLARIADLERRTIILSRRALWAWALLIVAIYTMADHAIRTLGMNEDLYFGQSLISHAQFHAFVAGGGVLALLASVSAIPWRSMLRFAEKRLGARHSRDAD